MCGIAGFINFKKDISKEITILKEMVKTLDKRGPNAEGFYSSKNVQLGHRRLIVLDPKGGLQPMIKKYQNNEYIIVYNGELYNTEDLRKELLAEGFSFNSYSDTEVLLTSYIAWGVNCVKKFNGIFAFAIYDKRKERIFIARDSMGVKPLFYTIKNNTFIFGSEIKTLLANPLVDAILDEKGLTELFSLGPAVLPGSGVLKDIKELAPAEFCIINKTGIQIKEYWHLEAKEFTEDLATALDHTKYLLTDAIKRQLIGDVPLCTFLSGGLDSSIISAIASK